MGFSKLILSTQQFKDTDMIDGISKDDLEMMIRAVVKSNLVCFDVSANNVETASTELGKDIMDLIDNYFTKNNPNGDGEEE